MRKKVVEIKCDRCGRMEHVSDLTRLDEKRPPEVSVKFFDVTTAEELKVEYEDLCTKCQGVVSSSVDRIRHYDKKKETPEYSLEDDLE